MHYIFFSQLCGTCCIDIHPGMGESETLTATPDGWHAFYLTNISLKDLDSYISSTGYSPLSNQLRNNKIQQLKYNEIISLS